MANTTKRKKNKRPAKASKKNKTLAMIIISIVMLTIIGIAVGASIHNVTSETFFSDKSDYVEGVDVSEHNGKIKWDKLAKKTDFAIVRVAYRGYSDGKVYKDKKAEYNLKHANEVGIKVGAYVYTQAITVDEAIDEAKMAIKMVKKYQIDLPIFIDYEYANDKKGKLTGRLYDAKLNSKEATEIINAFCKEIKKAGYTPGVYASSFVYRDVFNTSRIDRRAIIWVADYNENVTYDGDYDIWQYTSKGKMTGNGSRHIDKNYWYIKKSK